MDALINDGIGSNSILENTKNAQKHYNDVYSALEAGLATPGRPLSVGVEVEIGEKSEEKTGAYAAGMAAGSNTISISNPAQARVAPDLRSLRSGQDIHNHLKTVSAGLDSIRGSIDKVATQIKPGENYGENDIVQKAVSDIHDILQSVTYAGKPVFSLTEGLDKPSALEVETIPELTEKKYASIQSTIMTNAEQVSENAEGQPVIKGSETFMLAKSNSAKVFSFPQKTPLDKINDVIADYTQDPVIHPLIHFNNNGNGELSVVTGEGKGPVDFGASLEITSIDGELFSTPLETYSLESSGEYHQRDGRVIEGDNSMMMMSEELGENRATGAINLADDNVRDGVDLDNMRESNHSLTRSEKFNERLGRDRREGDGFAVTPLDPGASSGSLTAGSELRDSSRSTNYSAGFDAMNPEGVDDVMLLPEEDSSAPYLTLAQRAAGVTGNESLDQLSKKVQNTAGFSEEGDEPERYRTMLEIQNGVLGSETLNQLQSMTAQDEEGAVNSFTAEPNENIAPEVPAATALEGRDLSTEIERNVRSVEEADGIAVEPEQDDRDGNPGLAGSNRSVAVDSDSQEAGRSNGIAGEELAENDRRAEGEEPESIIQREDAEGKALVDSGELSVKGSYLGVNPVRELEKIENTVPETLAFTLQGQRGELDYVMAAGVSVDTMSMAINSTADRTGVSADIAGGRMSISGVLSPAEVREISPVENVYPGNASGDSLSGEGGEMQDEAAEVALNGDNPVREGVDEAAAAVGLSGFRSGVDMTGLGETGGRQGQYSLESFALENTPAELSDNPQLARRVVSNAYRRIDTLQANIESLNSLNQRDTYEALDNIGEKILDGQGGAIADSEESENLLNNIAVGINNTLSASGGRRMGLNTVASINLLSSVEVRSSQIPAPQQQEQDILSLRLTGYQGVGGDEDGLQEQIIREQAEMVAELQNRQSEYSNVETMLSRFEQEMAAAAEAVIELRDIVEGGVERRENNTELVERAEQRYYDNIENARLTIRELGRVREAEDADREFVQESMSEMLYAERQVQLGTAEAANMLGEERLADISGEVQESEAVINMPERGVASRESQPRAAERRIEPVEFRAEVDEALDRENAGSGNILDSMTSARAVAVSTSSGNAAQVSAQFEEQRYEGMVKLFEDKIGTVMVHGQGYTMKDIEGRFEQMAEAEPEVVISVLDKASEDIESIRSDAADLQAQELDAQGWAVFDAMATYGSEQSASNPVVFEKLRTP